MTAPPHVTDASAGDPPPFDPAALERLRRFGGAKLLNEMIALFLAGAPERIAAAQRGTEAGDAPATEMALHSLKSSSAQLGAMHMQRLSAQGEQLARDGDLSMLGTLVRDLDDEFTRVHAWLINVRDGGMA